MKVRRPFARGWLGAMLAGALIAASGEPFLFCSAQPALTSLVWDAPAKARTLAAGETSVRFVFSVTNVSTRPVSIQRVATSCGCTVAQLPAQPWRLAPGEHGELKFTMDLRGRRGSITKTGTIFTSAGVSVLTMTASVPGGNIGPAPHAPRTASLPVSTERARNQALAGVDHQAVFRGDCAKCHAEPAKGKLGIELYAAVCGICHDAKHRAEMVPALGTSEQAGNPAYWRTWITFGNAGTLMPAFSKHYDGPLDRDQIESLCAFLAEKHPPAGK
ncbi:MAG: mono/diheme cytochrome c family protein [Candidatus Binatia bacterium]|jgi:mono/diheme cytochrome c family protein